MAGKGGGSSGTSDYDSLDNKPRINGVELSGDKSLENIGAASAEDVAGLHDSVDEINQWIEEPLPVSKGGTGNTSFYQNYNLVFNGEKIAASYIGSQRITINIPAPVEAGWRRICAFTGRYIGAHFMLFLTGSYSAARPTNAVVMISASLNDAVISTLSCNYAGKVSKIRIVYVSNNNFYLDVYIDETSSSQGDMHFDFLGLITISDIIPTNGPVFTDTVYPKAELTITKSSPAGLNSASGSVQQSRDEMQDVGDTMEQESMTDDVREGVSSRDVVGDVTESDQFSQDVERSVEQCQF